MNIQFGAADLEKWAAFSGDYNPIHFEAAAAARLGLKEVVVHGMLAMLPLKATMEEVAAKDYPDGARWTASLLNPVPLSAPSRTTLDVGKTQGKSTFTLSNERGDLKFIKGLYSRENFDRCLPDERGTLVRVPADEIAEKVLEFQDHYPYISRLWVFLDALIFYLYVKRNSQNVFAAEIKDYLSRIADPEDASNANFLVVHATHTVMISPTLLHAPLTGLLPRFGYSVRGKDMIHNLNTLYGIVEITIWLDDVPGLIVEMGLMAKK
ncbi:hypothetical protein CU048_07550 [Beijerinckiaceae bacterium]|nr:hypothetical protein CU048_07550 [Beijerinckiaceae bacterium]